MNDIASRYADALYSLALDANDITNYQIEAKIIYKLLRENDGYIKLLSNSFITNEEKEDMIDKTFINVNKNIVNLIKIVCKNHRQKYLIDIFKSFNSLCNSYRGVKEGLLYSSIHLKDELINQITDKISKKEQVKVELYNVIDPNLIGGVKVVIDGHIYDGSISTYLANLKSNLK